ncbi:MAG: prepilin-type N-terminal cleavage/methylation domain-containing protein [Parahaliea sp.]
MRTARPRAAGARGFSLLEVLVALVVLSLSLGALYQASTGATRNLRSDERYAYAVELARSLLADSAQAPAGGLRLRGETAGEFRWSVATQSLPPQAAGLVEDLLQAITVEVAWADGAKTRSVVLDSVVETHRESR